MRTSALLLLLTLGCATKEPCPEYMTIEPNSIQKCECSLEQEPMCICWEEPMEHLF